MSQFVSTHPLLSLLGVSFVVDVPDSPVVPAVTTTPTVGLLDSFEGPVGDWNVRYVRLDLAATVFPELNTSFYIHSDIRGVVYGLFIPLLSAVADSTPAGRRVMASVTTGLCWDFGTRRVGVSGWGESWSYFRHVGGSAA